MLSTNKASKIFLQKADDLDKLDGSTNTNDFLIKEYRIIASVLSCFHTHVTWEFIEKYPFLGDEVIVDKYEAACEDFRVYDDFDMENDHTWIQIIFPITERSNFNPKAPILNRQEVLALQNSKLCRDLIQQNLEKFTGFLDRTGVFERTVDHNHLRISRVIKSLRIFNLNTLAISFYNDCVMKFTSFNMDVISNGKTSLDYWLEALTIDLPDGN